MNVALMRVGNIVRVGLVAIRRNKIRSSLTVLGVLIGVACVIVAVAMASGTSRAVQSQITSLGSNFIMIFPGAVTQSGQRIFTGQSTLTEDDALAIKNECPSVAYVSPGSRTAAQVVAGELNWGTSIYGAGVDWPFIRAWNMQEGAFFTETDVKGSAKVCVIGSTVADNLFPSGGAVGSTIRIKNVPFRVLGVLEKKGGNQMGQDQDDQIVAPYTTVLKRLQGSTRLQNIFVGAASPQQVDAAKKEVDALLRQRHRLQPGQDSDFMMRSQDEIASTADQASSQFKVLLSAIAAVSLLGGGIGIMNIMLVSVTERTREIGIRLAIGAKSRHVLLQFLLEAVVLSVVGGAVGVGAGFGICKALSYYNWSVAIEPMSVVVSFGVAALVGVFFGFYPAWKASRMDPIEALRYE